MFKKIIETFSNTSSSKHSEKALINAYARQDISFVRGVGATLIDSDEQEYLDALGGIAVCFLGHSHPQISETISLQASTLLHTSNLFHIQQQAQLGQRFCEISGMDKVFFCSTGTEANELAIKLSRLQARKRNIDKPIVICANDSFHGRSFGSMSATGNAKIHEGFEPLVSGFEHVNYNDIQAVESHANNPNVVAVMVEPIQGEAGIVVPDEGYLQQLRKLCDKHGWLLILDEIQSGVGRTGKWFAYQHEEILPDIVTSAKALGNGIPIGACAARGAAAELISPGKHGTTFGGNPFACQVALKVLEIIEQENYLDEAARKGKLLKSLLSQHLGSSDKIKNIRGRGLMIGIELDQVYPDLVKRFLQERVVVNATAGGKVIRLLPSVITSDAQLKHIAEVSADVIGSI